MTEQIGTLEELGVKPGDVVLWIGPDATPANRPVTVSGKHENGNWYHVGQRWGGYIYMQESGPWELISQATPTPSVDLTAIREPFGLLDKATQDALVAHGGPYQRYYDCGWGDSTPVWANACIYRAKPGPKRETVTKDAFIWNSGSIDASGANCTITYDTIDGVIDVETYKVTKK